MTTAEIMFADPGSRTLEHEYNARTILYALGAAILIHFVVAFSIALLSGMLSPSLPIEEKPVQLTFVDLPGRFVPKNSAFIETDESRQSAEPPKEKTFESNANSIAATELPANGELPLPSQAGKDRPFMDLETHEHSLQTNGAQPQSSVAPHDKPQAASQAVPLTAAEQFAMLAAKPTPATEPSAEPGGARSAYRAQKQRTRISGNITNRGNSSVNALGTPLGRYEKIMTDSIGSRWYAYVDQKRDLISIGTLQLRFSVDRSGTIKNLQVTENTSNEAFANICLQSVLAAHLPPIPDDVANALPSEGLQAEESFIIY